MTNPKDALEWYERKHEMATEMKPCPFCGSRSNDPDCHDEDCYISQLLAIASALINGHKASEMEQARENLAASWNTRYEMNCHMQR